MGWKKWGTKPRKKEMGKKRSEQSMYSSSLYKCRKSIQALPDKLTPNTIHRMCIHCWTFALHMYARTKKTRETVTNWKKGPPLKLHWHLIRRRDKIIKNWSRIKISSRRSSEEQEIFQRRTTQTYHQTLTTSFTVYNQIRTLFIGRRHPWKKGISGSDKTQLRISIS